jgi:hypothetical protein
MLQLLHIALSRSITGAGMTQLIGFGLSPPSFETRSSSAPQDEGFWEVIA